MPARGRASSCVHSCTNVQPCGGDGSASPRIPFGYTQSPGFQQWHPSEGTKINPVLCLPCSFRIELLARGAFCSQNRLEYSGMCLQIKTGTNYYQIAQPVSPQWDVRVSGGKKHDWRGFLGSCAVYLYNPYCPHYSLYQILQLFLTALLPSHLPNNVHILIALINFPGFNRIQS